MTLLNLLLTPVHILVAALNVAINPSAYDLLTTPNKVVGDEKHSTEGEFNLILLDAPISPSLISPVKLVETPILILETLVVAPLGPRTTLPDAPDAKLTVELQFLL